MGYYINPPGMTKEAWLKEHGIEITEQAALEFDFSQQVLPVCLVNNGWMTAAGIAYDAGERDVFAAPDGRPKKWYTVLRGDLAPYMPERAA